MMIEKHYAIEVRELALEAISRLSQILNVVNDRCTPEEYELYKKGVGLSIGKIQMGVLESIYTAYPDLDDLKQE